MGVTPSLRCGVWRDRRSIYAKAVPPARQFAEHPGAEPREAHPHRKLQPVSGSPLFDSIPQPAETGRDILVCIGRGFDDCVIG